MALIVTTHDLTTGVLMSDPIVTPNNCRITAIVAGAKPIVSAKIRLWVDGASGGKALLLNDKDKPIIFDLFGNGQTSINPVIINASNLYVEIIPQPSAIGTVSIDVINS